MPAFDKGSEAASGRPFRYAPFASLIFLLLGSCAPAGTAGRLPGPTGIAGLVADRDGSPAAAVHVYAYRNPRSGLRGPADFESVTDAAGEYFLDLAEGNYYLVARIRRSGGEAGPPRPGDAWALYPHNPVEVQADRTSRADFHLQGIAQPMLLKNGSLATGDTGFAGRLVDGAGRPVPGAFVLAYRDQDTRRMPDATSTAVGEDGKFVLYVPQPGQWCLAARTRMRGQPQRGELYAAAEAENCREVEPGQVLEVREIVLRPYHTGD